MSGEGGDEVKGSEEGMLGGINEEGMLGGEEEIKGTGGEVDTESREEVG